ncbi:MAG: hypothetical protein ACKVLC_07620 [Phycisphaerales bacterium]|tara:strand:- start:5643 stop:6101 length:459 start_codon:yes stop_codon:yes gene_type:complete
MKIGTIIIIVSVVWSIISGILAKKQAAAKKLAAANALSTGNGDAVKVWKADPVQIRVESLRRRNRIAGPSAAPSAAPSPVEPRAPKKATQGKKIKGLTSLYAKNGPLRVAKDSPRHERKAAKEIATLLLDMPNLRNAILLNEILSKPVALRQ